MLRSKPVSRDHGALMIWNDRNCVEQVELANSAFAQRNSGEIFHFE